MNLGEKHLQLPPPYSFAMGATSKSATDFTYLSECNCAVAGAEGLAVSRIGLEAPSRMKSIARGSV